MDSIHTQFGADAATEAVVSWAATLPLVRPRVRLGTVEAGLGSTFDAVERTYVDALTGERVWTYHCPFEGLEPDAAYRYQVCQAGATPASGRFRTAPAGRSRPFRFTSFGDHGIPRPAGRGVGPWSRHAGYVVDEVEAAAPLFHLVNGDLSYANVSDAPTETWREWFDNVSRSARRRPWMPCAGNHENEPGNGPQGYLAYQTRFFLPDNGAPPDFVGNWYAFTAGSVRVVAVNGDDFCLQDGGFSEWRAQHGPTPSSYIRGYSGGLQLAWLERTLDAARRDEAVDWIVVVLHQVAMSSAPFNGADLGLREAVLPVLDRYGVDLVVSGHEHHYERSHPVRGVDAESPWLTPAVASFDDGSIDTTAGRVHVTMGVGGNPTSPKPDAFAEGPAGLVIVGVDDAGPDRQRLPRKAWEPAEWLAAHVVDRPFGYTVFDVDPGVAGGVTRIEATHFGARAGSRRYEPVDRFTLERPRRDAPREPAGWPATPEAWEAWSRLGDLADVGGLPSTRPRRPGDARAG